MFLDESGFMLQPLLRRTWAPIGETPLLEQWDRRDRLSVVGALALSPRRRRVRMFFKLLDHNAKAEDFLWFLIDLRFELGRELHVVWDNLGATATRRTASPRWGVPGSGSTACPPTPPSSTRSSTSGRPASGARWPARRRTTSISSTATSRANSRDRLTANDSREATSAGRDSSCDKGTCSRMNQ
nr:transposase [Posidoniimonas corsicana]